MFSKRILFYLLILFVAFLCTSHSTVLAIQNNDQPHILQSASEQNYPPFAIVKPDGTADGFSVALLKAVAQVAELEVNISVGPWNEIKEQLAEGRLDVLPLVGYTPERDKVYDFTVPYLRLRGTIFVREGEKSIQSEADLKGKEVLVMRGDNAHEYAVNNNLTEKLILTTSFEEAIELLSSGKHDAVFCQYLMGLQLINKLGIKNIVSVFTEHDESLNPRTKSVSGFEQKFCIAVPEGKKELLSRLNEGLSIVVANGTYDALYEKWFGPIVPYPEVPVSEIIKAVAIVLVPLLLLAAVVGGWFLRREVRSKTQSLRMEIQERKLAEDRYKDTIEISIDGFWVVDIYGRFIEVNDAYCAISGYDKDELLLMSIMDVEAQQSAEEIKNNIQNICKQGSGRFESVHRQKNGKLIDVDVSTTYSPTNDGMFFAFVRDITERKQAEKVLAQSEERFRLHFENAPMPYQSLNYNGFLLDVNPAWLRTLGYSREEVIGKSFGDFLPPEMKEHFKYYFPRFKDKGEILGVEFEIIKKDGSAIMVRFNGRIGYDDDGKFKQTHCIFHDITEFLKADKQKKELEVRLQQAQKMEAIGTLAGGIAHDFNNILSVILGFTEMAKDDCQPGSSIYKDLDEVLVASNRAKGLVQQILTFSRQEDTERIILQPASIVKETIAMLRPSLPTTIEITQDIDAVTGLVFVDPSHLNQILMNLCTNAFHAMEDTGGKLDISLKEVTLSNEDLVHEPDVTKGTFIQLSISDSGTGIAPTVKDKIFDPYFTTKETGKGTGMGLSMVHGIVKNYGGFISLYSELGEGTVFHVFLPTVEKQALTENEINDQIPLGRERILFVDDEEILATMGKTILERLGYHVTVRNSSIEALETFQNQPDNFDIIITDQTMPGMTGSDLSRRMLQIRPDIPIILCTGYSTIISEEKAKSMGIKEFAFKPLAKKDIAKLIRKVLDVS